MQNRLMLPAWLGAGLALRKAIDSGAKEELETMCEAWPFFSTRIGMLEMVYSKADLYLAEHYDRQLVEPRLWPLGQELRQALRDDIEHTRDKYEEARAGRRNAEQQLLKPFMMYIEGYKYMEIAEKLHIPEGTVKSRIFKARKKMQSQLTQYGYF